MTFNSSDKRVVATLRAKGPAVIAGLERTLDILMLELQRLVQSKLQGIVLKHHSGKLAGSITKEPIQHVGSSIVGMVTGAAGPAFYGKIQEKGGTRTYEIKPVHAKALAFFPQGSLGGGGGFAQLRAGIVRGLYSKSGASRGRLKESSYQKFGNLGGIVVAKVIHPPLPPRPFMRPSLDEMRDTIVARLQASITVSLKG
jgi:hypothetical protein